MTSLFYFSVVASIASGLTNAALAGLISHQIAMQLPLSGTFIGFMGFMIVVAVCFDFAAKQLLNLLVNRSVSELRMSFAGQVLTTPFARLESLGTPRLFALLTDDIQVIGIVIAQLPSVCIGIATIIGCIAYLTWLSPVTMIGFVAFSLPMVIVYWLLIKRSNRLLKRVIELRNELYGTYRNLTEGMKELKLHNHRLSAFYHDHLLPIVSSGREATTTFHRHHLFAQSLNQFSYFVIIFGLFAASYWSGTSLSVLGAYAIMILYLKTATMSLISALPSWSTSQAVISQVEDLGFELIIPKEISANEGLPVATSSFNRLDVKSLTYNYRDAESEQGFQLGPISTEFQAGEVVFITGGNGSGKTTFVKLLLGLYAPNNGQILLDGKPMNAETMEAYRQNFSAIFAEPYLFPHLMGLENDRLDEHAEEWLERLQLTRKVSVVDGKLTTIDLSFGQRKRLALLTAYLEGRPIFVFDEWAAGQDPEFRDFFYRTLVPELKAKGKLVIAITHDDQYFESADRILKFDSGELVTASANGFSG